MKSVEAPPVQLVLRGHAPTPARIGVVYQPLAGRLAATLLFLAVFWTPIPWLVWVPPHYPWPLLSFSAGAFLAFRAWIGRYRVEWFAGECPRCASPLRLRAGDRISLPHAFTCYACHFEPELEAYDAADDAAHASDEHGIRHVLADCAGTWRLERRWDQEYVACYGCTARHHSTPALAAAARDENDRGRLLHELASEGRFLT